MPPRCRLDAVSVPPRTAVAEASASWTEAGHRLDRFHGGSCTGARPGRIRQRVVSVAAAATLTVLVGACSEPAPMPPSGWSPGGRARSPTAGTDTGRLGADVHAVRADTAVEHHPAGTEWGQSRPLGPDQLSGRGRRRGRAPVRAGPERQSYTCCETVGRGCTWTSESRSARPSGTTRASAADSGSSPSIPTSRATASPTRSTPRPE